ncbi:MAG TPA: UDP-3-O-(3-hydroxymyristoyl)glucosamine N-acyltransferase [Anaeromyxobacteraceae bacterium]|nr:UDP-3-O-(3-hydroxymyristoyl)glucosamine N-acyltransferase [Anaeromyxobacteraceae bacterium]
MAFTLAELAARVGGEVEGDGSLPIERVRGLEDAGPGDLSFYANRKYRRAFEASRAAAVIVGTGEPVPPGRTVVRAADAYLAFAKASTAFHPPPEAVPEMAPEAVVHPGARVHPSAQVMPLAFVAAGAEVGARTVLYPGVFVGAGARVGDDCILYPNAVVREGCLVGHRCILQPGCVVGSDGFGFAFDMQGEGGSGPRHYKVPQAGIAVVEDDVEVGANSCVDRATMGRTVVGRGSKLDNLVQVAHNVELGPLCLLAGQVGIAGSTRIGMGAVFGGQAGAIGHLEIGDGARFGAQTGVLGDVPAGETYTGYPAIPHAEWLRTSAAIRRLPELLRRVRELEKEIAGLKEGR